MAGNNSLERKIEQIISSGEEISDRLANVINELVESEAYSQLPTVLSRILGENIQQQVTSKSPLLKVLNIQLILIYS